MRTNKPMQETSPLKKLRLVLDTNIVMDMLHFADRSTAPLLEAIESGQIDALTDPETMPAAEIDCRRDLRRLGVAFRAKPKVREAAMVAIEACVRLIPGVLGSGDSLSSESFEDGLLEHPQYTRPRTFEGLEIPEVLLSGDHKKVDQWRQAQRELTTRERRPDLWQAHLANSQVKSAKLEEK